MIRSEHTGTGPLSSQLLQKARQALQNDGKVDAQEMAEIKQALGETPSEDALKFVANLENPSVISAVALVDSPIPLDERVKEALARLDSSGGKFLLKLLQKVKFSNWLSKSVLSPLKKLMLF
jgi:hypothetical protein